MARRFPADAPQRHRRRPQSQGYSLVEILVALLISGLVVTAAVRALIALIATESANQQELNRKNTMSRALGMMQAEILNAVRVQTGGTTLAGCTATPLLTLFGATASQTITYGLRSITPNTTEWQGPNVLVRCGPSYGFVQSGGVNTNTPILDTGSIGEQEVVDTIEDNGFTRNMLSGTGAISRSIQLSLASRLSGGSFLSGGNTTITSSIQVPININQIYSMAQTGETGCQLGCDTSDGDATHWKPAFGDTIEGDYSKEDVIYFDGPQSLYTISGAGGRCVSGDAAQTAINCTVTSKATPSNKVTIYSGDLLVFGDGEIRIPAPFN